MKKIIIFIILIFLISSSAYGENYKMNMVYSSKTDQTRIITYDSDKTKEADVDMYVTFFKGGSTILAATAAKMNNIEVITIDQFSTILIKQGCTTEACINKALDGIPLR